MGLIIVGNYFNFGFGWVDVYVVYYVFNKVEYFLEICVFYIIVRI